MAIFSERFKSHHNASSRIKDMYRVTTNKEEYLLDILGQQATKERVLYVHVPYCTKLCSFCLFPQGDRQIKKDYHNLIIDQIKAQRDFKYMKKPFSSVYFGGGTPTSLEPYQMDEILKCIHDSYTFTDDCEISVETSITELSTEMIDTLLRNKVDRLSIGVQSFDDSIRKRLGRRGSGEAAKEKIRKLKQAGFKNVNIDLIYNNPGETLDILKSDIDVIIEAELAGISFYSLMLFDNSPLSQGIKKEELSKMNDIDYEYEQFMFILNSLQPYGYNMFEFTKIIRNNLDKYKYIEVRQNIGDCIAIGLGAGGTIGSYAYYNMFDFKTVSDTVPISAMGGILGDKYFIFEKFTGDLQKMKTQVKDYNDLFDFDVESVLSASIEKFIAEGLCVYENGLLSITEKGSFWGNNIIDTLIKDILQYIGEPSTSTKAPGEHMRM